MMRTRTNCGGGGAALSCSAQTGGRIKKELSPKRDGERERERESGVGATGALTELSFKMGMGVDGGPC